MWGLTHTGRPTRPGLHRAAPSSQCHLPHGLPSADIPTPAAVSFFPKLITLRKRCLTWQLLLELGLPGPLHNAWSMLGGAASFLGATMEKPRNLGE